MKALDPKELTLTSAAALAVHNAVGASTGAEHLDHLSRTLWRSFGDGAISDDEAAFLQSYIDRRRPLGRNAPRHAPGSLGKLAGARKASLHAAPAPEVARSPSIARASSQARRLGKSCPLISGTITPKGSAPFCAGEVKHHGICDLPIDKERRRPNGR